MSVIEDIMRKPPEREQLSPERNRGERDIL